MFISAQALADQTLAKNKNCFACHAVDQTVVGPSFKDVATRYRGDTAALNHLVHKIQKGGDGVWGNIPMPPNTQVNDVQAKKLTNWILAIK